MPPKGAKKTEISNRRDITVNGYEYVELEGQRFVENEDYDHKRWFYSLMKKINAKYPQFRTITDKLAYTDKAFKVSLNQYSSTLDAMTVIISDTYDRKMQSKDDIKQNIKYNILNDFGRMGFDINDNKSKGLALLNECRRNPSDEFIDYVFDMLSSATKYANSYGLSGVNRDKKENVNARCFAMVGMADMIGMSDLVPRIENVQVFYDNKVFKEGILYKSNAQHSIQNSDIDYLVTKDNRNKYPQDSPKSLENTADINVMFWLSGRKPLYINDLGYDIDPVDGSVKFKFISFDSPEDFGSYPEDKKAEADKVLDSITMVSRKTAENIIKVDTRAYRQMLANSGISGKAVDAGVERLEALQAKIRENKLDIVDDWQAQWEKNGMKKLSDGLEGIDPVGGIYSSLYHPEDAINQIRLGRNPEPKTVETVEYFDTYYKSKPEDYQNRLKLIGDGDPKLGFYMLHIAATPASSIYPGSGSIKASRIQENLNSLLNDRVETLDTLKLQILREEAKLKIDEMSRQTPAKRREFERNLVSVTVAAQKKNPSKYVKGSSKKWRREKTAIELKAEKDLKSLQIVVSKEEKSLDSENIRKSYQAIRHLERQVMETLSFFSWDSEAFESLSALSALDLNDSRQKSLAEMQFHIQTMSQLAKDYAAQYTTAEQKNKNDRRARRISLTDKIKAVGEACLANTDPIDILEDLPEANEKAAAEIWFEDLLSELDKKGINFSNKMSLALVKELKDENIDNISNIYKSATNPQVLADASEEVDELTSRVFMKKGMQGQYNGDNLLKHLHDNMRDPSSFSNSEKLHLYKLAKENKLILDLPTPGNVNLHDFTFIRVNPVNGCSIKEMPDQIDVLKEGQEYPEDEVQQIKKAGFKVEGFSQIGNKAVKFGNLRAERTAGRANMFSKMKPDNIRDYQHERLWQDGEKRVLIDVVHHPQWFTTEEQRNKLNSIYTAKHIKEELRSEEETRILDENPHDQDLIYTVEKRLMKKFNVQDRNMIPFDKIRREDGTEYGRTNDYNTIISLVKDVAMRRPVSIDNVKYVYNIGTEYFDKVAPAKEFINEIKTISEGAMAAVKAYGDQNMIRTLKKSIMDFKNYRFVGENLTYDRIGKSVEQLSKVCEKVKTDISKKGQALSENEKSVLGFSEKVEKFCEGIKNNVPDVNTLKETIYGHEHQVKPLKDPNLK